MSTDSVLIELTSRQVDLMVEYTCPFDSEKDQLEQLQKKRSDLNVLKSDDFYAPLLIGDITHYARDINDAYLLDELIELAEIIDMAISDASNKSARIIECS